jgi:hypothetical protein
MKLLTKLFVKAREWRKGQTMDRVRPDSGGGRGRCVRDLRGYGSGHQLAGQQHRQESYRNLTISGWSVRFLSDRPVVFRRIFNASLRSTAPRCPTPSTPATKRLAVARRERGTRLCPPEVSRNRGRNGLGATTMPVAALDLRCFGDRLTVICRPSWAAGGSPRAMSKRRNYPMASASV